MPPNHHLTPTLCMYLCPLSCLAMSAMLHVAYVQGFEFKLLYTVCVFAMVSPTLSPSAVYFSNSDVTL